MRILFVLLLGTCFFITLPLRAQERTAGGSLNMEANWSALKNLADQASAQAKVATITANDAKKRADDALAATAMIINCGKLGQTYNGSGCTAAPAAALPRLSCRVVQATSNLTGMGSQAWCQSDEIVTGGGGAAETPGSGICAGTSHGFVHTSMPSGNSWVTDAFGSSWSGDICSRAYAVCCKLVH